ncbi:MAG TPA: c-type cytochrome [Burkholderiaceae bacterium]|nr:c-type cytochrome [Burkholderiaceae bacterium]
MSVRTLAVLTAAIFGFSAAALAADPPKQGWSFGKDQYNARCAPCHGANGKGAGPAAKQVGAKVPDITTYAKRNGGAFPTELAWQKIDGRPVSYDTARNMPVWGRDFRHEALANVNATAKPESYVAAEIYAIVEHLRSMQVK